MSSKNSKTKKKLLTKKSQKTRLIKPKIEIKGNIFKKVWVYLNTWFFNILFWLNHIPQFLKISVALILTATVVGGVFYISKYGLNNPFSPTKETTTEIKILNNSEYEYQLGKLQEITRNLNPIKEVYKKIKYENLPIYPSGWVKRHFTDAEIRNTLVSGESGDFDKDGLSNKAEFLYGSDPKNKYTLCGKPEGEDYCKYTDKENVDRNISPLTGFKIEEGREVLVTSQDTNVISSLQESFSNASNEGVDFPSLYQKSLQIDLTNEMQSQNFQTTDFTREVALDYIDIRVKFLDTLLGSSQQNNQVSSLIAIYQLTKVDSLKELKDKYSQQQSSLQNARVPDIYKTSHQALLLMVKKVLELLDHRIDIIQNETLSNPKSIEKSQKLSVEIVWSYRKMSEELTKLQK